jgi:hypothetical protein
VFFSGQRSWVEKSAKGGINRAWAMFNCLDVYFVRLMRKLKPTILSGQSYAASHFRVKKRVKLIHFARSGVAAPSLTRVCLAAPALTTCLVAPLARKRKKLRRRLAK